MTVQNDSTAEPPSSMNTATMVQQRRSSAAYCARSSPVTSVLLRPNSSPAARWPPPAALTHSTSRWQTSGRKTSIALSAVSADASSGGTYPSSGPAIETSRVTLSSLFRALTAADRAWRSAACDVTVHEIDAAEHRAILNDPRFHKCLLEKVLGLPARID